MRQIVFRVEMFLVSSVDSAPRFHKRTVYGRIFPELREIFVFRTALMNVSFKFLLFLYTFGYTRADGMPFITANSGRRLCSDRVRVFSYLWSSIFERSPSRELSDIARDLRLHLLTREKFQWRKRLQETPSGQAFRTGLREGAEDELFCERPAKMVNVRWPSTLAPKSFSMGSTSGRTGIPKFQIFQKFRMTFAPHCGIMPQMQAKW